MEDEKDQTIRFNSLKLVGGELENIKGAITRGNILGGGYYTDQCQTWLQANLRTHRAYLTHSCTAALEMAAILSNVGPGDEVIMPSYTFVSTANAFVLRGATPVFVDVREADLNIDCDLIEAAITKNTKAIVPVHYAGVGCDMTRISEIASDNDLLVIEDAAQGIGNNFKDASLGAIGHLGCLSFHQTKNVVSGEGGALLVNDESFAERAEIILEKGTDRRKFMAGQVDKYTWRDIGSSYLMSDMISAFLLAQLEQTKAITARRIQITQKYEEFLAPVLDAGDLRPPGICLSEGGNGHIFYCFTRSNQTRNMLMEHLNSVGVAATFHYIPLHSSPAGQRYGKIGSKMEVTDWASNHLIRFPLHLGLTDVEIERTAFEVRRFFTAA